MFWDKGLDLGCGTGRLCGKPETNYLLQPQTERRPWDDALSSIDVHEGQPAFPKYAHLRPACRQSWCASLIFRDARVQQPLRRRSFMLIKSVSVPRYLLGRPVTKEGRHDQDQWQRAPAPQMERLIGIAREVSIRRLSAGDLLISLRLAAQDQQPCYHNQDHARDRSCSGRYPKEDDVPNRNKYQIAVLEG